MGGFSRREVLLASAASAALPYLPETAMAQDAYPSRQIRLIVGFTPGTATHRHHAPPVTTTPEKAPAQPSVHHLPARP